jgi:hypothetical protein
MIQTTTMACSLCLADIARWLFAAASCGLLGVLVYVKTRVRGG